MKLAQKNISIQHDGATFWVRPRNVRTIRMLSQLNEEENLYVALENLIAGWEGVTDDDGAEIKFDKKHILDFSGEDANAIYKMISDTYDVEVEEEKNS